MVVAKKLLTRMACLALIAACGGTAHAQNVLLNPSFETPGAGANPFANWTGFFFGPNISRTNFTARTGTFCCKLFGQFNGEYNGTGIVSPTTNVLPNQNWNAQAYFLHVQGDALAGQNFAELQVQFLASNNDVLEVWTVRGLDATSPQSTATSTLWQAGNLAVTAPDEAARVRVIPILLQPAFDAGAVYIDDVSLVNAGTTTTGMLNPGFEFAGGFQTASGIRSWSQFPRFASNIFTNSALPRTGGFAGFMFGQFNGSNNFNGVYQIFDVQPGQLVNSEVFMAHLSTDPITGGNYGFLNLEFYNASNVLIEPIISNVALTPADPASPPISAMNPVPLYKQVQTSAIAPAGAARVRMVVGMFQQGANGGGIHFDDASISIAAAPPAFCPGNANGMGGVNFDDVTAVLGNFGTSYEPGSAGLGDANNDGSVNFDDITTVLSNFGNSCL